MKKLFYILAFALATTGFAACSDDEGTEGGTSTESGINSKDFDATVAVSGDGEVKNLTFDAKGTWSIVSAKTWCSFEPSKGSAGKNTITLTADPNESGSERSAKITITVEGHKQEVLCTVVQNGETPEPSTMNDWIHEMMGEYYLWNEEYRQLDMAPYLENETIGFSAFLQAGLEGVDAMDHINIEDGGWVKNKETGALEREFFSNVKQVSGGISYAPAAMPETRAQITGLGFVRLMPTYFTENSPKKVGIGVLAVYPDSPAAEAGIGRGTYINRINGATITELNYKSLVKQLSISSGTVRLGLAEISVVDGQLSINEQGPTVNLTAAAYEESVFYYAGTGQLEDGRTMAYLTYGQFEMTYDQALLDLFKEFKQKNVTELVLDLRYNGGGHVMSSTMLATLIAGDKYKDQIYTKMEYNRERTEAGKIGEYRIGNSTIPDGNGVYSLIVDALQYSLNLDHVYVIGTYDTASASEMIINGLRGLGIDVRLVGQQTHGKNVGMEVWQQTSGTTTIQFSPITFRAYNAKGECDYADGFTPDYISPKENEYAVFPFGSVYETVAGPAMIWMIKNQKPSASQASMLRVAPGAGLRCGEPIDLTKKAKMTDALVLGAENE